MQVRCPRCHAPFDSVPDTSWTEILCPACGSSFSLIGSDTTATYQVRTRMLGHFELLEEVGVGQFGSVWKARDTKLERQVAIKIPRQGQLDPQQAEFFLRDARAAAQLKHPHIVGVHEVGLEADTLYIVSDYIQGANLREWLSGQRLTVREATELVIKISRALDHAHEAGVVHRDLKPGNIMMDMEGQPHIIDFGLARRTADDVTMTVAGQVLGTPAYMSPEQARGEAHRADRRSDIYSLGVILYELLTGETPFRGEARMLVVQILRDEPPSPRKLNARIPRDLETITLKCLAKEPGRRYQTAQALADDLDRYLRGQPINARPVGRVERAWRWAARNRAVASLAVAVLVLLATGTIVSSYFGIRARAEANLALSEMERADAQAAEAIAQKSRADVKAAEAEIEAEKARHVARFLAKMFEESAPIEMLGLRVVGTGQALAAANLTAREILDRGAERVTIELQDQPVVRAALKDTMGNVYLGMGMIDKAEALLEEAIQLRRKHLPAEHLDIASSWLGIGHLRFAQFRFEECVAAFREALAIRRKLLGDDHELVDASTVALAAVLGLTFRSANDIRESEDLFRTSLAWRRRHFGNAHIATAFSMLGLAGSLLNLDGNAEATALILEATPILLRDPTTKPLGLAISQLQQAELLWRLGQADAALASARKSLATVHDFASDDHLLVQFITMRVVGFLRKGSKFDEAEKLSREWVQKLRDRGGPPSFVLVFAMHQLADLLVKKGNPSDLVEVEKLDRECMSVMSELIRLNPTSVIAYNYFAWELATCAQAERRNGKKAVEYATKACELTAWKSWSYIDTLAAAYAEQGNFEEAIRWSTKAAELIPSNSKQTNELHKHLELFKSGQPIREKPRSFRTPG